MVRQGPGGEELGASTFTVPLTGGKSQHPEEQGSDRHGVIRLEGQREEWSRALPADENDLPCP